MDKAKPACDLEAPHTVAALMRSFLGDPLPQQAQQAPITMDTAACALLSTACSTLLYCRPAGARQSAPQQQRADRPHHDWLETGFASHTGASRRSHRPGPETAHLCRANGSTGAALEAAHAAAAARVRPPTSVTPAGLELRLRLLALFCKSVAAANAFPQTLQVLLSLAHWPTLPTPGPSTLDSLPRCLSRLLHVLPAQLQVQLQDAPALLGTPASGSVLSTLDPHS